MSVSVFWIFCFGSVGEIGIYQADPVILAGVVDIYYQSTNPQVI